jgi:hypothetical protein
MNFTLTLLHILYKRRLEQLLKKLRAGEKLNNEEMNEANYLAMIERKVERSNQI